MGKPSATSSSSKHLLYAQGAIVRIRLENFVTYDSLEFSPGANLNVIIGPNGTGKSTIVCAICLGMTGKPVVLGRAANISDYIKYEKKQATIEIELNNQTGENFVVRRILHRDNKSEWFLNDRTAKLKEIEDLVNGLNIQVSNLCQFLPQEKVSEFARMNPQELLENTEKAVGGLELYDRHMELKENGRLARDYEKEVRMVEENLKKEEAINSRLEAQVSSYMEKKKFEESIVWLKRKKACLIYQQKRLDYEHIKKDKNAKTLEWDKLLKELKPLEEKKLAVEKKLAKEKQNIAANASSIQACLASGAEVARKLDEYTEKMADFRAEFHNKENEAKGQKAKIKELQRAIQALKSEIEEAKESMVENKKAEAEIKKRDADLTQENEKLSSKEYELRQEIAKLRSELESNSRSINNMKNVREEKLNKMRQRANHAYMAITWLERNRSMFRGRVFEPMFLLINVKTQTAAKYVENAIPNKDLTSMFLFESSDDMHLFVTEVRDRLRYVINAAIVPSGSLDDYQPQRPIEAYDKRFGFQTYLREVIDAPEPILVYLCLYTNIHQVPVGTDLTQRNIGQILPKVPEFKRIYTNTHQYNISTSRYTGKVTSSSAEVSESYWLTSSVDQAKLNELEEIERERSVLLKELETQLAGVLEERQKIEKRRESLRNESTKLRERAYHYDGVRKKLSAKTTMLKSMENEELQLVGEAQRRMERLVDVCKKQAKALADYVEVAKNLVEFNKKKVACIYQDAQYQSERMALETELRTYAERKHELEPQIEQFAARVAAAKHDAQHALEAASKVNEIKLENGLPDTYKQHFARLPDAIEQIDAEVHQIEAVAQCASDVDERIVDEYDRRQKQIESLRRDLEKKAGKLRTHQSNYEATKNEWLESVEAMIGELNGKFAHLFGMLKCQGEVGLARPDNTEDFAKYGICIKVSFRTNERLQELTAWQQSGGEKSVSTMMYMIALQEMTRCPFRVVDEINQGMDPVNERKVFDIIVQNSCAKQYAQYFLLTPKLLPDLAFDAKTKVICVYNGPHNLPHHRNKLSESLEIRRQLNLTNQA